jgi:hypothetical protein
MITFTESESSVTLEMARDDYYTLMLIIGYALGAAKDRESRAWLLRFLNDLNRTNPNFTAYEI